MIELHNIIEFHLLYFLQLTGINLNHMLCAAESDPFQGDNYRIAAVIHESILCPILNKLTVLVFATPQSIQYSTKMCKEQQQTNLMTTHQQQYTKLTPLHQQSLPPKEGLSETTYFQADGSTAQLIHRKTNPTDYQQHYTHQHHHQQSITTTTTTPVHDHIQNGESSKAVLKDDYVLDPEMDVEIIEASSVSASSSSSSYCSSPSSNTSTITAEYTMPTTKID